MTMMPAPVGGNPNVNIWHHMVRPEAEDNLARVANNIRPEAFSKLDAIIIDAGQYVPPAGSTLNTILGTIIQKARGVEVPVYFRLPWDSDGEDGISQYWQELGAIYLNMPGITDAGAEAIVSYTLERFKFDKHAAAASLKADWAKPTVPTERERHDIWLTMGWGGRQNFDFSPYMYHDWEAWQKLISTSPYKELHEALCKTDESIVPAVVEQMKQRGIRHIYSMGPTASVDALLLEQLIEAGIDAVYHPVDASIDALGAINEINCYLTSKFGEDWSGRDDNPDDSDKKTTNMQLAQTNLEGRLAQPLGKVAIAPLITKFENVRGGEKSCVIYSGGTLMNNRNFWPQTTQIAREDGIVVASIAMWLHDSDPSGYWLSIYDTPEGKDMFTKALRGEDVSRSPFRDLFLPENREKWDIAFEYVTEPSHIPKWADYQVPKISVQLKIKEPFTIHIDSGPIHLRKTRSWKEAAEWENWRSEFRQWFDNDADVRNAIEKWDNTNDENHLPEYCRMINPIELAVSIKPSFGAFFLTHPATFGLKSLSMRITREAYGIGDSCDSCLRGANIDYELNGQSGTAMGTIFVVERETTGWPKIEDPPVPRFLPPQLHYESELQANKLQT